MLAVILAACALPSISHVHTFDDGGRARVMSSGRIAIVKFDPVGCVNCGVVDDFWESAATNFQRSDFTLWRVSCALHRSVLRRKQCRRFQRPHLRRLDGLGIHSILRPEGRRTAFALDRQGRKTQGDAAVSVISEHSRTIHGFGYFPDDAAAHCSA